MAKRAATKSRYVAAFITERLFRKLESYRRVNRRSRSQVISLALENLVGREGDPFLGLSGGASQTTVGRTNAALPALRRAPGAE